ncbi:MAG TPA: Ig-like domain-containing protein [Nitrospirota bacterium]|nr:Ig-like domain-containing protein [Nitrospirota bacterium]
MPILSTSVFRVLGIPFAFILAVVMLASCSGGGSTTSSAPPAALTSITVTPANTNIAQGTSVQMVATGTYSNNSHRVITTLVTWSSSSTAVATISNTAGSQGRAAATMAIGPTTITAALNGISGVTTLGTSTVASIDVTPDGASIAPGTTQQFTATATLASADQQDLTSYATWSSLDTGIATFNTITGLATAINTSNSVDVTATYTGVTGTATLIVSPVSTITVTPAAVTIAKGTTQQFTATGTLVNNTTQTLTSLATWSSTTASVATISNASGSKGRATAVNVGITSITATFDTVTSAPASTLTVTAAAISSITVTPASASVALGQTKQFTARATLTDNSTQDVTSSVTWHSSNTAVATVNSSGLSQSNDIGTTSITASTGGVTSNTAVLTVTAAQLQSILVAPVAPTLFQSLSQFTQQFIATGIYSDGGFQDLTTVATWSSSNTNIATISNSSGSHGLATLTVTPGSTNITATFSGITSNTAVLTSAL